MSATQLLLFGSAVPARRARFLIGYRAVEHLLYPGKPFAILHFHREALYISPEGLYRLHWWQATQRGRRVIDIQTWYTPLPKPGVRRVIAPPELR